MKKTKQKKAPAKFSSGATTLPMTPPDEYQSDGANPFARQRRQMKKTRTASPDFSSGATTLPMTPPDEVTTDASNPFEIGHKRGSAKDSVYTRFLRDTASSSIKPGAKANRGSKD